MNNIVRIFSHIEKVIKINKKNSFKKHKSSKTNFNNLVLYKILQIAFNFLVSIFKFIDIFQNL